MRGSIAAGNFHRQRMIPKFPNDLLHSLLLSRTLRCPAVSQEPQCVRLAQHVEVKGTFEVSSERAVLSAAGGQRGGAAPRRVPAFLDLRMLHP